MPTLNKYIDKEGYYIRSFAGAGSTLQVTAEALRRIQAEIGQDEGWFSTRLLKELLSAKLIFTMGLHPIERLPYISVKREFSNSTSSTPRSAARLVFAEDETGWHLALRVVELPRQWVEQASNLVEALKDWKVCLIGGASAPAMQLWPGRGGIVIPVEPQQSAYNISPEGRWPDSWDVPGWLGSVPGLNADVTLFDATSGERLPTGAALEPEGTYFLVAPAKNCASHWAVQSLISPEEIGQIGSWYAWAIELPAASETLLRSWCEAIGYCLAEPRFKVVLVSPPARFDEHGLPVVNRQEEIVVGLLPVGSTSTTEYEPIFYTTSFQESGSFRLSLDDVACTALQVVVEDPAIATEFDKPTGLEVDLAWGNDRVSLRSLHDGVGPHKLPAELRSHDLPEVQVDCPAPLSLTWELGSTRERRERVLPDDAGTIIAELLQTAFRQKVAIKLQLDAGSYGRLSYTGLFTSRVSNDVTVIPVAAEQRARWLAAALGCTSHSENVVPIPASTQRTLARLADFPGCASLRSVKAVPIAFIPHLHAITRLVQN